MLTLNYFNDYRCNLPKEKKGAFYKFLQIVYLDFSLRKINKLPNLKTE